MSRPIRLRAACRPPASIVPDARAASFALGGLADDYVTDATREAPEPSTTLAIPPQPPVRPATTMSSKKARKSPPPASSATPDPAIVRAVSADVTERLTAELAPAPHDELPPGVVGATVGATGPIAARAGFFSDTKALKKLVDAVMPALIKGAMIAADGKLDKDEVRELAELGYDLVKRLIERRGGGDVTTTPSPPGPSAA